MFTNSFEPECAHEKAENILYESRGTVGTVPNWSLMVAAERHPIKPEHKRCHQSKGRLNSAFQKYIHFYFGSILMAAENNTFKPCFRRNQHSVPTPFNLSSISRLFSTSSSLSIISSAWQKNLTHHFSVGVSFLHTYLTHFSHLPGLIYSRF